MENHLDNPASATKKTSLSFLEKLRRRSDAKIVEKERKRYARAETYSGRWYNYAFAKLDNSYKTEVLDRFTTGHVLDLGAGEGEASDYLESRGMKTTRLDISDEGLKKQPRATQATSWRLPFADNSFDGAHSKDMFVHIPHKFLGPLFSEIKRVTKPEGIIILCAEENKIPVKKLSMEHSLLKLAQKQGFSVADVSSWEPPSGSSDWHPTYPKRFVLQLRNNK